MDDIAGRILAVAELGLIRRVARCLGVGRTPGEVPGARRVIAGQLGREQLTGEPFRIVGAAIGAAAQIVETRDRTSFLGDVSDVEIGPLDLVVVVRQAERAEQIETDVVLVGPEDIVVGQDQLTAVDPAGLPHALATLPAVVIARHEDGAERAPRRLHRVAAGQAEAEVRRGLLLLEKTQRSVFQRLAQGPELGRRIVGAGLDPLARPERQIDAVGKAARAVVEAREVRARSIIDQVVAAGELRVRTHRSLHREEGPRRRRQGLQVDDAAAEFTGEAGGIGLLNGDALEDVRREQVQRDHALQRLGAGKRGTVQQRRGIALAKTANIDEPAFDDRQAGDAGQGRCGGGIARTLQVLGREEGGHLGAGAVWLGNEPAQDHDLIDIGRRRIDVRFGLRRRGLLDGSGRVHGLSGCDARRDHRACG